MSKDIKDYLHLYLGCECICKYPCEAGERKMRIVAPVLHELMDEVEYCKPILRPRSDMRIKEQAYLADMRVTELPCIYDPEVREHNLQSMRPEQFIYLLSKGFDIFDLIPAGLAIDKTQIVVDGSGV